jgi:lipopolysaccharide export system permease protein
LRILFISSNRIGDAVLTTGLLAWLEAAHPKARFTIVCGPVAADLFRAVPRLERLIVLKKKKYHGHWFDLWQQCIGTRWDLIVDLRNSLVARLLLAQRKAYKPAQPSGRHKVEDLASLLNLSPPPAPRLWLDKTAKLRAEALIPSGLTQPLLALAPAANWPPKQWPIECFIELAKKLTAEGEPLAEAKLLIVAAPHEREQLLPLLNAFPAGRIIDAIGNDLLTVAACLQKARLFIGNDSGLMHIAAAMGTPTLGLFGPGHENIYGPWGEKTAIVRTPESASELFARLPYAGAFAPLLMGSLTVAAVYDAAQGLIKKDG